MNVIGYVLLLVLYIIPALICLVTLPSAYIVNINREEDSRKFWEIVKEFLAYSLIPALNIAVSCMAIVAIWKIFIKKTK